MLKRIIPIICLLAVTAAVVLVLVSADAGTDHKDNMQTEPSFIDIFLDRDAGKTVTQKDYAVTKAYNYPEYFAGAWIDDDGTLVVRITRTANSREAVKEIKKLTQGKKTVINYSAAGFSYNYLWQVLNEISAAVATGCREINGVTYKNFAEVFDHAAIDERSNRILIYITDLCQERIDIFKEAFPDADCVSFREAEYDDSVLIESIIKPSDTGDNVKTEIIEVSSTEMTFSIENISQQYVYDFGSEYRVEIFLDGKWYKVPTVLPDCVSSGSAGDLWVMKPASARVMSANWKSVYGVLPAGRYRLIKWMNVFYTEEKYDSPSTVQYKDYDEKYTVAIEFEVK